jgi:hypothetical protein
MSEDDDLLSSLAAVSSILLAFKETDSSFADLLAIVSWTSISISAVWLLASAIGLIALSYF